MEDYSMKNQNCGQCRHFNAEKNHCEKRTETLFWGVTDCKALTVKLEVWPDSSAQGCAVFATA
jgi:hypothetical protein